MTSQFPFFDATKPTSIEKAPRPWMKLTHRENFTTSRAPSRLLLGCGDRNLCYPKSAGSSKENHGCINMGKRVQPRPKANVSSYIHFMLNFRNKFKEQQPNTYLNFKEFSRKCSEKWRSISKHEKAKYEALAKLDKARYQEEMVNYMGKRRKRRKKDPKAPRKPPSSFLLFSLDNYAKLKQENPNWTVVQVAKAAGKMWSMTADVDKKPYEQKAALMRAKYLEDRDAYHSQCPGRKKTFSGSVKTSSKQ